MIFQPFSLSRLPRIVFGAGMLAETPALLADFGRRVLLVIGSKSLRESAHWPGLINAFKTRGFSWEEVSVTGEPSPMLVDHIARDYRNSGIDVVLGIGGGSVLDAAKAIAGLLPQQHLVMDYLEGVGPELPYRGPSIPFIAVPTTAGTGSEATKNAVLSQPGKNGFKKSFRDEQLVAQYAIIDPDLLASCPPALIAANGMDALTQLMESYVSLKANPLTDALALSGMEAARDGLLPWYEDNSAAGRGAMAYAALLSGITLAQTGLGAVHGLAAPLGAFFPIPHGVVCGTLMAATTEINIRALRERAPTSPALEKYARLGALLNRRAYPDQDSAHEALIQCLSEWTQRLRLPPLSNYGIGLDDFDSIIANCRGSSMKTNPLVLHDAELGEILSRRLE